MVAFSLFGVDVYWYGVLIALGLLLAAALMLRREKRLGLPRDVSIDMLIAAMPVAVVCARAYYVAFSWEEFRGDLRAIVDIRGGGLAIYGGVIGGFIALWIFARVKKLSFLSILDLAAPSLALGQAVGRWGNFANAEAYGRAVAYSWQRFFPFAVYIPSDGLWHYAAFFYESAWCLVIVAALLLAERRGRFHRRGDVFLWYLALYGAERAFVEGLRIDSLYFLGARVSQLLSAALLAAAVAVFALRAGKRAGGKGYGALAGAACALASPWLGGGWATAGALCAAVLCGLWAYGRGRENERGYGD